MPFLVTSSIYYNQVGRYKSGSHRDTKAQIALQSIQNAEKGFGDTLNSLYLSVKAKADNAKQVQAYLDRLEGEQERMMKEIDEVSERFDLSR